MAGEHSDVFRTTVFPAAIAGMIDVIVTARGAFHGQIKKLQSA